MKTLFTDNQSILIRMPNWLGDNIMCLPAITELKKRFAGLRLTIVCPSPFGSLWRLTGLADEIVTYQNSLNALRKSNRGRLKSDVIIVFPNSFSSGLSAFLAGGRIRIGYSGNMRNFLLTDSVKRRSGLHQVDEFYYLIFHDMPVTDLNPVLQNNFSHPRVADTLNLKSFMAGSDRLIALAPGAAWGRSKKWHEQNYAVLIKELTDRGYYIVLIGLESELSFVGENHHERVSLLNSSLDSAASVLASCHAAVGNDSGIMHLAAAVGCRSIIIYGATDWRKTFPRTNRCLVVSAEVPCQPCWMRSCPRKDYLCLTNIKPVHIIKLLERF
jgi:lipopolysaccharide heptosyltransferase II